jgi:purine-nucleoside phosphorylase
MGGPSAAIYYTELIELGVTRLVRVGTAGGLADGVRMGDTIVALSATGDDLTASTLVDGEVHAPTATFSLVEAAVRFAREGGTDVRVGPVVTSGLFYDHRPGIMRRWKERGHLCVEMEVAILYTIAAIRGIEALGIMTVSDMISEEGESERISDDELARGVDRMMRLGCRTATV